MKQTKKWNLHFTRKKPPLIKMNTKCVVDTAEVYYTPKKFLWWFFLQKNHQTQGSQIFKLPKEVEFHRRIDKQPTTKSVKILIIGP